jgi:3-isopropylmalate/(R)-2-methylmalate dehydratase small subunit
MIRGRVWRFGDAVDTDQIMPTAVLFAPPEVQAKAAFSASRPGWAEAVRQGDVIVAGRNFGIGSGRPAPLPLLRLGIACVIADSLNGLFLRNAVSYGLPAIRCPGIAAIFAEGDFAEIEPREGRARNASSGATLAFQPVPPDLWSLMSGGGILPQLEAQGLISPPRAAAQST